MTNLSQNDLRPADLAVATATFARDDRPSLQGTTPAPRQRRHLAAAVLEGCARASDFCIIAVVGVATSPSITTHSAMGSSLGLIAAPLLAALIVIILQTMNAYRVAVFREPARFGKRLGLAWILVFGLASGICAATPVETVLSTAWLVRWGVIGGIVMVFARMVLFVGTIMMARRGMLSRRVAIVGGGADAQQLLQDLSANGDAVRIVGLFDDRADDRSPDVVAGFPKLGTVDELITFARHTPLDLVIFTLPITAEQRILGMLRKLWVLPVDIRLAAHRSKLRFHQRAYSYIGQTPVIDLLDKPIAEWDVFLKAVFDKGVGLLCLLLFAPVFVLVALAVKLDSRGPVLFRQRRYGFNNEIIEVFKFRSMFHDQLDFKASRLVTRNDPRVTRVGRIIRKTSLDELPQLFNVVFKGDLSLVGPRPHALQAKAAGQLYDDVVDSYVARHRVRPGMTGWAQVNGWRGETDTPEKIQKRVECDLYYIENWSMLFDLQVLVATPFALLFGRNVY